MSRVTNLTVKGQVTIPKDVRDALGLKPGDPVEIGREGDRAFLRKATLSEDERRCRYEAALADIDRVREQFMPFRIGRSTDEIMQDLRGDEPLP
ncbi:AbrB/MazE/SpoVT family DNA-binding domain-containing protein [Sphingomonas sp.]|jgi:AbrB family looped-hinge helix DNA binding protein|uniref:AbrB/MazE/SpoVT family DNA-binding domain-containing protein n=1 Tax=Sphingomonas sp. TaxID=28214 RepID=UPI002ED820C8